MFSYQSPRKIHNTLLLIFWISAKKTSLSFIIFEKKLCPFCDHTLDSPLLPQTVFKNFGKWDRKSTARKFGGCVFTGESRIPESRHLKSWISITDILLNMQNPWTGIWENSLPIATPWWPSLHRWPSNMYNFDGSHATGSLQPCQIHSNWQMEIFLFWRTFGSGCHYWALMVNHQTLAMDYGYRVSYRFCLFCSRIPLFLLQYPVAGFAQAIAISYNWSNFWEYIWTG